MLNDKFYSNTLRTEDDVIRSIQGAVPSVAPAELLRAVNNVFAICDECVKAEGNHFQQLFKYGE